MRRAVLLLIALGFCGEADAQVFRGRLAKRTVRVYRQPVPTNPVRVGAASLVADGGFESPSVGARAWKMAPADSPWTFTKYAGLASNGSEQTARNDPAPEGTQVAWIQSGSAISQSFTAPAAGNYAVRFSAALRHSSRQSVRVLIDGAVIGTAEPEGTWYGTFTTAVFSVAAGVPRTLRFETVGGGDNVIFLDNVALVGSTPPTPPPVPPTPPAPVNSFRVIFVTESGANLPLGAQAVQDARIVRDYLTANTTPEGGQPGFRQYDPNVNVTNEQPGMKALWLANKDKVTTLPAVIVEVNGVVTIEPWPKPAAEAMLDTFKKRREGK